MTKITFAKSGNPIGYSSRILSLGSCFAENIGLRFRYFKFQNDVNPFGIIFNPVSIENLVERVVNQRKFTQDDIFFHNGLWHCFEVHSESSHPDKESFIENLNKTLEETQSRITRSTHIIITYGTSWIYRNNASGTIVANCHKVPQDQFTKEILSAAIIEQSIQNTVDLIRKVNPDCHFVFTVSPVRHIKDGFVENQRSKAHLITALHSFIINHPSFAYFPSYEIMMDELRDYRFYAEDMLHPSQVAIDYIWERFAEKYISEECIAVMDEISAIQKSLAHRPFNPDSESHQKFLRNLQLKIDKLQQQFPHFSF